MYHLKPTTLSLTLFAASELAGFVNALGCLTKTVGFGTDVISIKIKCPHCLNITTCVYGSLNGTAMGSQGYLCWGVNCGTKYYLSTDFKNYPNTGLVWTGSETKPLLMPAVQAIRSTETHATNSGNSSFMKQSPVLRPIGAATMTTSPIYHGYQTPASQSSMSSQSTPTSQIFTGGLRSCFSSPFPNSPTVSMPTQFLSPMTITVHPPVRLPVRSVECVSEPDLLSKVAAPSVPAKQYNETLTWKHLRNLDEGVELCVCLRFKKNEDGVSDIAGDFENHRMLQDIDEDDLANDDHDFTKAMKAMIKWDQPEPLSEGSDSDSDMHKLYFTIFNVQLSAAAEGHEEIISFNMKVPTKNSLYQYSWTGNSICVDDTFASKSVTVEEHPDFEI